MGRLDGGAPWCYTRGMRPWLAATVLAAAICAPAAADSPDFPTWIAIARRHGLPMPTAGARLVLVDTGYVCTRDGSVDRFGPGFLEETEGGDSVITLCGTRRTAHPRRELALGLTAPADDPMYVRRWFRPWTFDRPAMEPDRYRIDFFDESSFVCAIQLAACGDSATAGAVWRRFAESGALEAEREHERSAGRTALAARIVEPPTLLGRCLFDHWCAELSSEGADFAECLRRLEGIAAEFSVLVEGERAELLADLAATMRAPPPTPGSIEAQLVTWSRTPRIPWCGELFAEPSTPEHEPARAIVLRGAEAVSILVTLFEDRRVTAHLRGSGTDRHRARVGELACELSEQITGLGYGFNGDTVRAYYARTLAWLDRVRVEGEAGTLARAGYDRARRHDATMEWVFREGPLRVVGAKHPDRLAVIAADYLDAPWTVDSVSYFASAVAASTLPRDACAELLVKLAQRGTPTQRRGPLQGLASIAPVRCVQLLMPLLDELRVDGRAHRGQPGEATFTDVVRRLEDLDAWRVYLRTARRGGDVMRHEMVRRMNDPANAQHLTCRLAFVAWFMDDESSRVSQLATAMAARMLDIDAWPTQAWSAEQWTALRALVRERLRLATLPDLSTTG